MSDWCAGGIVGYFEEGTLTISNCSNSGDIDDTADGGDVGGIVGGSYDGTLTINNCSNSGDIHSDDYVGGIVGDFDGGRLTISNCINSGHIYCDDGYDVGGIVGYSSGDESTISNCMNIGDVEAHDCVGGIAGYFDDGTISRVYNKGTITGEYAGTIIGENDGTVEECYYKQDVNGEMKGIGDTTNQTGTKAISEDFNTLEEFLNYLNLFEELFRTAQKHPDQTETNDIGIAEDGSIVNLDLWNYEHHSNGWTIGWTGSAGYSGYTGEIVDGKIQGQIPMYIKRENEDEFLPVTMLQGLFEYSDKGDKLTIAPTIPSTVTNLYYTFSGCTNLTVAPDIPNGVTSVISVFSDCTSLTTAPDIPNSVISMSDTFTGCTNLTGTIIINANPTYYTSCFYGCATNDGCNLVLNGSSTMLNKLLGTKSANSHISIAQ